MPFQIYKLNMQICMVDPANLYGYPCKFTWWTIQICIANLHTPLQIGCKFTSNLHTYTSKIKQKSKYFLSFCQSTGIFCTFCMSNPFEFSVTFAFPITFAFPSTYSKRQLLLHFKLLLQFLELLFISVRCYFSSLL